MPNQLSSECFVTPLSNTQDARPIHVYDLLLPYAGAWSMRVEMMGPVVLPDGPVTVQLGASLLRGFVVRTSPDRGHYVGVIIGGQAQTTSQGIHHLVPAQQFWQTPAREILTRTLAAVGETLASDSTGVDTVLSYPRRAVRCDRALDDIADALGLVWRVKLDGSVWFGSYTWPASPTAYTYQSKQPDVAAPLLAPDPLQPLIEPGTTVTLDRNRPGSLDATPQRVTVSRYWSDEKEAYARLWLADADADFTTDDKLAADRIHGGFAALARAATRGTDWYRTFQGQVVTQRGDGTLDITLDRVFGQGELPPLRGVAPATVNGGASSYKSGDRVAIYFEGGDFRRPRATTSEPATDATLGVARQTDTVGQAAGLTTWAGLVTAVATAFTTDPIFATFAGPTQSAITALSKAVLADPIGTITSGSTDLKLRK